MTRLTLCAAVALAAATAAASADTSDGDALMAMTWPQIVEEARGGEVNWFMWGGSDVINRYVSDYVGGRLADEFGITLNRVPITDAAEIVNLILGEKEAGNTDDGAVDLIWINGENFRTMKQGDLAWCGYPDLLPNNALIDWDNPAIANDFGVPVDGCEVPWNTAQFSFAYNTALYDAPPTTIPALIDWVAENPGQFTYPAPPDFNGSVFVRHVFYHAAGGVEALLGPFDQALYDEVAPKAWEILNSMEPDLWREGATYPTSIAALQQLYAGQEVGIVFDYDPAIVGINIVNGTYPPSTQGYAMEDGTIGNTNYTLIPFNSPNKAAALVTQNLLLSGEAQLEKAKPDVWGTAPGIDVSRLPEELSTAFADLDRHPAVVDPEALAATALPELQAEWIAAIEQGWLDHVGRN